MQVEGDAGVYQLISYFQHISSDEGFIHFRVQFKMLHILGNPDLLQERLFQLFAYRDRRRQFDGMDPFILLVLGYKSGNNLRQIKLTALSQQQLDRKSVV